MSKYYKERDYGMPDSEVVGIPRLTRTFTEPMDGVRPLCPNCGCETLCEIEVNVQQKLLRGGKGVGRYLSCPACPWASPMACQAGEHR